MRTHVPPANGAVWPLAPRVPFALVAEPPDLRTKIARLRVQRRISQADLARTTGLSLATVRRLERGQLTNPPIRFLTNVAIALDVPLEDVIEPEWVQWSDLGSGSSEPPDPRWIDSSGAGWTRSPHAARRDEGSTS